MLDILIILFLIMLFWAFKVAPNRGFYLRPLTLEHSICLKGICAMLVVFCHISQKAEGGWVFPWLGKNLAEVILASLFFALSGYGVMKQFKHNQTAYLHGFYRKRLGKIFIPGFIIWGICFALERIANPELSLRMVLRQFASSDLIRTFSWFLIAIAVCYVGFGLFMRWFHSQMPTAILSLCVYLMLYMLICQIIGLDTVWYSSMAAFVVGVVWANWEEDFMSAVRGFYWLFLVAGILLIVGMLWGYLTISKASLNHVVPILFQWGISMGVTLMLFLLCQKFRFQSVLWGLAGTVSYEIFLVQGIILYLFRNDTYYVRTDIVYAVTVVVLSVVCGIVLHFVSKGVTFVYRKVVKLG